MKFNGKLSLLAVLPFAFLSTHATASTCTGVVTAPATCTGTLTDEAGTAGSLVVESLTLSSPSSVTLFTTSYGGGTNLDGTTTGVGGFMPSLTLFDTSGFAVAYQNGTNSPIAKADPATGLIGDAYVNDPDVPAGSYFVILSDLNNMVSASFTGFGSVAPANFYTLFSGPGGTSFQDEDGNTRNGNYALNIETSSLASAVPEPATAWLVIPALAGVLALMRRRRSSVSLAD